MEIKLKDYMNKEYINKLEKSLAAWDKEMKKIEEYFEENRYLDVLANIIDHGRDHLYNVYSRMESLLLPILEKKKNFFTSRELFYLISSAFLHDIGCKGTSPEQDWEYIRPRHSILTQELLNKNYEDYGLEKSDGEAIGLLCAYHAKKAPLVKEHFKELKKKGKNLIEDYIKDGEVEGEKVRFRLLAAILQICDACDRQANRYKPEKVLLLSELTCEKAESLRDLQKTLVELRNLDSKEELMTAEKKEEKLLIELNKCIELYEKKYMLSLKKIEFINGKIVIFKNNNLKWSEEMHRRNLKSAKKKIEGDLLLVKDILSEYAINIKGVEIRN